MNIITINLPEHLYCFIRKELKTRGKDIPHLRRDLQISKMILIFCTKCEKPHKGQGYELSLPGRFPFNEYNFYIPQVYQKIVKNYIESLYLLKRREFLQTCRESGININVAADAFIWFYKLPNMKSSTDAVVKSAVRQKNEIRKYISSFITI